MNASSLPPSGRQLFDELQLHPNLRLRVGEHIIDIGALRVTTRPELTRLSGKSLAVLIELARHAGATITRGQLLDRVWVQRVTTPDVLTQAIAELRRAFRDDAKSPCYIETVPRVGYRLLASVALLEAEVVAADDDLDPLETDALPALVAPYVAPVPIGSSKTGLWALLGLLMTVLLVASAAGH
jgi:DNA-binding winged helix-turn-helix (wHTH) protein